MINARIKVSVLGFEVAQVGRMPSSAYKSRLHRLDFIKPCNDSLLGQSGIRCGNYEGYSAFNLGVGPKIIGEMVYA